MGLFHLFQRVILGFILSCNGKWVDWVYIIYHRDNRVVSILTYSDPLLSRL